MNEEKKPPTAVPEMDERVTIKQREKRLATGAGGSVTYECKCGNKNTIGGVPQPAPITAVFRCDNCGGERIFQAETRVKSVEVEVSKEEAKRSRAAGRKED